jgi:hypothetical protein
VSAGNKENTVKAKQLEVRLDFPGPNPFRWTRGAFGDKVTARNAGHRIFKRMAFIHSPDFVYSSNLDAHLFIWGGKGYTPATLVKENDNEPSVEGVLYGSPECGTEITITLSDGTVYQVNLRYTSKQVFADVAALALLSFHCKWPRKRLTAALWRVRRRTPIQG